MFLPKLIINKNKCFFSLFLISNLIILSCANLARAEKKTNSNYGLPIHRRDGGSRSDGGNCVVNNENHNLVALIPARSVGINGATSPKLFFYIPQVDEPKTLEFVLRNEADELMYETFLTTTGKGIISVEVPADLKSNQLETAQNYHWYLSMICNPKQRSRDIVVEGWMRQGKVTPEIEQQLNAADAVSQAEIYQEQGFWYDALAVLAAENSDRVKEQAKWTELLESIGLEDFADAPFIETDKF